MKIDHLFQDDTGSFQSLVGTSAEAYDAIQHGSHGKQPVIARFVRGTKAQTVPDFYNEIAAALQFPPNFGENWDALHDSLCDLGWLAPESALVLTILASEHLLEKASEEDFAKLGKVLTSAVKTLAKPGKGKTARIFRVVFQVADAKAETGLTTKAKTAGIKFDKK